METIEKRLFQLQDLKYKAFTEKLTPNLDKNCVIGVKTPALRALAKELNGTKQAEKFLTALPHRYFEENNLHAFLIEQEKDYDIAISIINAFLPFVDNWATCDQLSPKALKKHPDKLIENINVWLNSKNTYEVRFGIGCLMRYFLDENFSPRFLERVAAISSEEYYINMMIAWYFATALAKQYEAAVTFVENKRLSKWVHNKTIQKAVESYRITDEQKAYLKTLKIK